MAIPILAAGAAISAGTSLFGAWQGNKQKNAAQKKIDSLNRPSYSIPQELMDNLSDAEKRTVEGLSAQQKQEFVKNLERNQVSNLKASTDRKSGLMGLQASTMQSNDAYSNLVSMDATAKAQSKQRKEAGIESARMSMANAKNKKFGIEQGNYESDLLAAQGEYQAGSQNQHQGTMSAVQTGLGFLGSGAFGQGGGGSNRMAGGIGYNPTQALVDNGGGYNGNYQ